jgi:hypothetical protein
MVSRVCFFWRNGGFLSSLSFSINVVFMRVHVVGVGDLCFLTLVVDSLVVFLFVLH